MELTIEKHGAWTLVKARGRIDATTSPQLETAFKAQFDDQVNQLAVDLAQVDYISSAGLRVLLAALKRLGKQDGKMALLHPHEYVMEVLQVSGFLSIFTIANDLDELV